MCWGFEATRSAPERVVSSVAIALKTCCTDNQTVTHNRVNCFDLCCNMFRIYEFLMFYLILF